MKSTPDRQQGIVYVASRLVTEAEVMFSPGAVAVADGSILLAGPKADVLRAVPAGFPRMEFPDAAIVPGLVNADIYRLSVAIEGKGWSVHLPNALATAAFGASVEVPVQVARTKGSPNSATITLTSVSESDPSKKATVRSVIKATGSR